MPHRQDESTEFTPDRYPPFPDGLDTIDLETISLQKIETQDQEEQARMFEACKSWGFFYLDLGDSGPGNIIRDGAESIARLAEDIMALPLEEKSRYAFNPKERNIFGVTPCIKNNAAWLLTDTLQLQEGQTHVDKKRTPDTAEFFNVAKNDMIVPDSQMRRDWPSCVLENKALFADYCKAAHSIGLDILISLGIRLGIDPEELRSRHNFQELAGDHVRCTRGPPRSSAEGPEIQTPSHTDFGSITILMNWLGGLQVYGSPNRTIGNLEYEDGGSWRWVIPKPGCAIVNLGDAAVEFPNGVLCSGRHRVIPAPGKQGLWPRYSIVYFVGPIDECQLKTLKGDGVPEAGDDDEAGVNAKDWIFLQSEKLAGRDA